MQVQQREEWGSGSCVLNLPGQVPKHLFQKQAREGDIWGGGGAMVHTLEMDYQCLNSLKVIFPKPILDLSDGPNLS